MRMLIAILFIGLTNCSHPASYFEGRRVLSYQDLRMVNSLDPVPEITRGCIFLKQVYGKSRYSYNSAKIHALSKAANLGSDTVVIGSSWTIRRAPFFFDITNNTAPVSHLYIVDAYYCTYKYMKDATRYTK